MKIEIICCFLPLLMVHHVAALELSLSRKDMETHFRQAFSKSRSASDSQTSLTKEYILNNFNNLKGKYTGKFHINIIEKYENIIMEIRGPNWDTDSDEVIMAVSVYGTAPASPGVNGNGSGAVALLEIAKALLLNLKDNCCDIKSTIILAAVDKTTYSLENFRDKYLVDTILRMSSKRVEAFAGAVVLDTIMNYQAQPNSQKIPDVMEVVFPSVVENVRDDKYVGNFLTAIGRLSDKKINSRLGIEWNVVTDVTDLRNYKIYNMELPLDGSPEKAVASLGFGDILKDFSDFIEGPHAAFWELEKSFAPLGLKAVFVTDTKTLRAGMDTCYEQACDDDSFITDENLGMLQVAAEAVTRTLLAKAMHLENNQELKCGAGEDALRMSLWMVLAATILSLIL